MLVNELKPEFYVRKVRKMRILGQCLYLRVPICYELLIVFIKEMIRIADLVWKIMKYMASFFLPFMYGTLFILYINFCILICFNFCGESSMKRRAICRFHKYL